MKLLHFITSIDKSGGGTTAYLQLLAGELSNSMELMIVTGFSPSPVEITNVRVKFLDLSVQRYFQFRQEFREVLKHEQPDLVHINGIWQPQCWCFQQTAQELGIKVILSPHGMLEPYIMNRHTFKKRTALVLYQHKALKRVDYFHATAESELQQIRKLGYMQPACVIANGIELTDLKPKTSWQQVRKLLFLSRVHPKKGIELLIEAVARLQDNELKIIVAGEGDESYIAGLKQFCREKKVSEQFEFTGGVYGERKWELYHQADLFVLPTYSENFGIVVAEALATGLPVITTTGTPWQELETEKCGWWIDLTVDNLVKAITEALQLQPEELRAMGARGRKLVEEKYEIGAVTGQMLGFYNQICKLL
jgi:glycosyltransferase involved in cell wall biosynthesis